MTTNVVRKKGKFWVCENRGKMYYETIGTDWYNEHNLSSVLMTRKPMLSLSDIITFSEDCFEERQKIYSSES